MRRLFRIIMRVFALLLAVVATIWLIRGVDARKMPDLVIWHTHSLRAEFHARDYPDGISFEQYQAIEANLDTELEQKIFASTDANTRGGFNRFDKSSRVFPDPAGQNWNRSFEINPANPVGGILLLHGASDSPYSVLALAALFEKQGFYILALRLPGNGTIPSGLKHARLDDWLSITRMGVQHVKDKVGADIPIYLGGYSVGAGLVLDYTLEALSDTSLVMPNRLFLYSPAIGITKFARFSGWDVALSAIPWFEKFAWMSIQPEYDPYKYNSFAKNAGQITHLLTEGLRKKILAYGELPIWQSLPPIITFQSLVDSTVQTGSLVSELYRHLPANDSELILFDINRANDMQNFIVDKERATLDHLQERQVTNFSFTLVTNESGGSRAVEARTRLADKDTFAAVDLNVDWPLGVYSLSHVAIPFRSVDPWYGTGTTTDIDGDQFLSIGVIAPRGEQGLLTVPSSQFMRLRHNPFFDYVAQRTSDFCAVCQHAEADGAGADSGN